MTNLIILVQQTQAITQIGLFASYLSIGILVAGIIKGAF
jgi:hypothetical protein